MSEKILLLKEFSNEVKSIDVDKNAIVDIPEQSEEYFISNGLDTIVGNLNANYTQKHYINNQSTTLGDGKVFEQPLDVDKVIKSVKIT